ncbi:Exocyst complex component EXOC3/Sec6 [Trinorchestia longiramus]|nr:Exocyst complex component EXOC3/Sec6 [Trinorchestia longiramus]
MESGGLIAVLGEAAKVAGSVAGGSGETTKEVCLANSEVEAAEKCAIQQAKIFVANMLQRPDQLHKVDQYRRRTTRKKASVEAMLKTAMQSQLDGVRTGLTQLQTALEDLHLVKQKQTEVEKLLSGVGGLGETMSDLREEYVRYSQYLAATENLKHIFTVPESIEKTHRLIADNNLLYAHQACHSPPAPLTTCSTHHLLHSPPAPLTTGSTHHLLHSPSLVLTTHSALWCRETSNNCTYYHAIASWTCIVVVQCLMDLENSRDDLLFELHKLPHQNPNDTKMLTEYFADVNKLSVDLGKQVWVVLQRALNTVRKEPAQLVTALRIVEREERADMYALQREKSSGFLPEGRPKKWREKAMAVLESSIAVRIEANQFEDRDTNKSWLIRHLEVIRLLVLEDLRVVKGLCVPCFPPHYDIVNTFIAMYHNGLANHLLETVESGLEDNEFVTLLSWVLNTYLGPELMGHPSLGLNVAALPPLLEQKVLEGLIKKYLNNVRSNYESWLSKALELESREWRKAQPPDTDKDGCYKTELPHLLHQMVQQNIDVANTISPMVSHEVILCSLQQLKVFAERYRCAIMSYRDSYFSDRSQIQYFTTYMIALANSCQALCDVVQLWRPPPSHNPPPSLATHFTALIKSYQSLQQELCDLLLEEALVDLAPKFSALLTPAWLSDPEPLSTICLTLNDYFDDYQHLHSKNYEQVLLLAIQKVSIRYTTALLQKRITLKTAEDRKRLADRVTEEADKLQSVFTSIAGDRVRYESPCDVIRALAEVIRTPDTEMLNLELPPLKRKYPDMTSDHLTALLLLRGDLSRQQVRQKVTEILEAASAGAASHAPRPHTIFSQIHISTSMFPHI